MTPQKLFKSINENFDEIISKTNAGQKLLRELKKLHHADIAQYLSNLSQERFKELFALFPLNIQQNIFEHLSDSRKAIALHIVDDKQRLQFLESMSMDEFSDIVDFTSDKELKEYFRLLRKRTEKR